jgi:hypothetical protein
MQSIIVNIIRLTGAALGAIGQKYKHLCTCAKIKDKRKNTFLLVFGVRVRSGAAGGPQAGTHVQHNNRDTAEKRIIILSGGLVNSFESHFYLKYF